MNSVAVVIGSIFPGDDRGRRSRPLAFFSNCTHRHALSTVTFPHPTRPNSMEAGALRSIPQWRDFVTLSRKELAICPRCGSKTVRRNDALSFRHAESEP